MSGHGPNSRATAAVLGAGAVGVDVTGAGAGAGDEDAARRSGLHGRRSRRRCADDPRLAPGVRGAGRRRAGAGCAPLPRSVGRPRAVEAARRAWLWGRACRAGAAGSRSRAACATPARLRPRRPPARRAGRSGAGASVTSGRAAAPATTAAAVPAPTLASAVPGSSIAMCTIVPTRTVAPSATRSHHGNIGVGSGAPAMTCPPISATGTRAASHSFDWRRSRSVARHAPQCLTCRETARCSFGVAWPPATPPDRRVEPAARLPGRESHLPARQPRPPLQHRPLDLAEREAGDLADPLVARTRRLEHQAGALRVGEPGEAVLDRRGSARATPPGRPPGRRPRPSRPSRVGDVRAQPRTLPPPRRRHGERLVAEHGPQPRHEPLRLDRRARA